VEGFPAKCKNSADEPEEAMNINRTSFFLLTVLFLSHSHLISAQVTIIDIPLPSKSFHRVDVDSSSFAAWLRQLPVKKAHSPVLDFRGNIFKKSDDSTVAYVVDFSMIGRRLEQCMDIVVRFYAEYCWNYQLTDNLNFPLPGGYWLQWNYWKIGFRPQFRGMTMSLEKTTREDDSYNNFNKFLNTIFNYSHTQQFYHAYRQIVREDVQIGDFIVRKGTKGHTVLIVDMAADEDGNMIALIGNGDTPACEFFLVNSNQNVPWINLSFENDTLPLALRRQMSWDGLRRFSDHQNKIK
jgi:hypothetical protein